MWHTCREMIYENRLTGEIRKSPENVWHCKLCAEQKIRKLCNDLAPIKWDAFITLTTRIFFKPPVHNILKLKRKFRRCLEAMRYEYEDVDYLWTLGVTDDDKLHYHILWRGPMPDKTWLSRKWHKLTRCYIVDIRPARDGDVKYIGYNAAHLPNIHGDNSPFPAHWDRRKLKRFRRIGVSKGLIPPKPKKSIGWNLKESKERWGRQLHRFCHEPPIHTW